MKTLYESILANDFDIKDESLVPSAIKEVVNNSVYDDVFDGTVELINDSVIIGWSDSMAHEFFFDRLYEGLKSVPTKITSIKFGGNHLKDILLHVPEKAEYADLKIWANNISINNYTSKHASEIKFKKFSILSIDNVYFDTVSPMFTDRSELSCTNLVLNKSYVTASANSIANVDRVVFSNAPQELLEVLKDHNIYPTSAESDLQFNPCELLIGWKEYSEPEKIVIFGTYPNKFSLAFTKGNTRLKYGSRYMHKIMKDGWKFWPDLVKPHAE